MRVLLVGNHWTPGPGGAETMLVLTAELLGQAGHDVVPFALAEDATLPTPDADLLPRSVKESARTAMGQAWGGVWSQDAARAVEAAVRRHRPDVAHVHHVFEGLTLAALHALHRAAVPVVMTLHDYRPVCPGFRLLADGRPDTSCLGRPLQVLRHRCLEGSRWRRVAAAGEAIVARRRGWYDDVAVFLAPSRFVRDRVVEGGLPAAKVRVVPNPVVVPEPVRRPDAPPVVAYTGRLVEEKGVHVLLDAARELPPGVRVRMSGSGRLTGALAARVRGEQLPVDLLGPGTPTAVAAELRRATVAVLPALWWENCPMAVLEAAAAGLPVVATAMGGIPELVENGRTGLLVPPGDAASLAAALTAVVSDPGRARRMGLAGRERVRTRHQPAAHRAALECAYDAAVAAVGRAAARSRW